MVARLLSAALIALTLAGCELLPTRTKVEVQRVNVPVPVRAVPPAELVKCGDNLQPPMFDAADDPRFSVALTPVQEDVLREFIIGLDACRHGWRAWALEGTP